MGVVVVAACRDGEEGEQLELPEGRGLPPESQHPQLPA